MTYSVASALSGFNAGQIASPVAISDSAADVVANLDNLEQLAAAGKLASITLTDSAAPNLAVTATQATLDASVLSAISGNFAVTQTATAGNLVIDGVLNAQGNTVVFGNPASQYTITPSGEGVAVSSSSGTVELTDIQAAQFSDTTVILAQAPGTIDTTTGNITELYGAVFGRLPDVGGLSFYEKFLAANPSIPLTTFAQYFLSSTEYKDNPEHDYANNTAGDTQFIEDCYNNLLHRTPSTSEVAFYLNNVVTPMLNGLTPGTAAYSSAETLAHAYILTYFSASPEFLGDVEVTAQNTPSAQHWLVLAPSYTLTHDGQASVTEGGTETFSLTTSGVAANTVLYYSLSGVTASEVSGGALSGTITLSSKGTASLPVTLTSTAGQDLSGDLTVSLSASPGGATLASASEPLTETAAVAKSASVTDLGAWPGVGNGGTSNEPYGINDSGQIIGGQSPTPNEGQAILLQNGVLTDLTSNGGEAWGINKSGQITGDIFTNGGATAVIYQNGATTDLASSGMAYNFGLAINAAGVVVGQATSNGDNSDVSGAYAALWQNGTITDLGTLAGSSGWSEARGINSTDQVVGSSSTASGLAHAFLWQSGTMTDLGTLTGATGESFASGINDAGQIVGASTTTGTADHAVLWQNGTITDLGAASGDSSFARAINNSGQIVGYSFAGSLTVGAPDPSASIAELWQNGTMTNLNSLLAPNSGWVLEQANAINDAGQIVGIGTYDGVVSGFELTLSSAAITATPTYTLTHDSQTSVTAGGTETFALTTTGVAANTVLYYTLSGVTAADVVGGNLTGTVTVSSSGTASLPVVLASTAEGLSGTLTASLSTTQGGATVASASEALAATTPTLSATITNLGAWSLGSGSGSGTSNEPFGVNDSNQIIGGQSTQNGGEPVLLQNGALTFLYSNGGEAWGINNSGQIAGDIDNTNGNGATAVIFQNGAITSLASSGLAYNYAYAINAAGVAVGGASSSDSNSVSGDYATLWQNGTITDLGTLPGSSGYSEAHGINSSDQVVGLAATSSGLIHAFLWQNGTMSDLGTLAGASGEAFALGINDAGQIVGASTTTGTADYAVVWQNGTITDLGAASGESSFARAINNSGQIVGYSFTGNITNGLPGPSICTAELWQNGTMTNLNSLLPANSGWVLEQANAISESGLIVGIGTYDGVVSGFELALSSGTVTTTTPTYTLTHDSQSSVAAGGTETFALTTTGVAANTTLYYTLSGVTAADVVGGALTGTVTVSSTGTASLPVTLASTAQGLSGTLTASLSTTQGGATVASASEALSATPTTYALAANVSSLTEGASEDLTLTTTGVAANTTLYYTLSGVTASEVVGGALTGTLSVSNTGATSFSVALTSAPGQNLSGNLTVDVSTSAGGASVASASVPLSETPILLSPASAIAGLTTPTGINDSGQVVGYVNAAGTENFTADLWQSGVGLTSLGTLGGSETVASAINSAGQVVGFSYLSGNVNSSQSFDAFLWRSGTLTNLGTLGGGYSAANGINSSGDVVGNSATSSGAQHAFLWESGNMTDLGTLGGSSSTAYAIDSANQIVGWSDTSGGLQHAFLWANGTMTDLGTLGGTSSVAVAIDNGGQVVGQSTTAGAAEHAFLWQSGKMTDLGTLGGASSDALAINASGQVVGQSLIASGAEHAFVWQNGTMTDLNSLLPTGTGWVLNSADAINDNGMVVGTGTDNGTQETFEITIPTAASINPIAGLTVPTGINASGDVVGYVNAGGTENFEAVLGQSGKLTNLGTLGGSETVASAINSTGEVVGYSYLSGNVNSSQSFDAFLWQNGTLTNLGTLGGGYSAANGINSSGDVVGTSAIGGGAEHAFLWESGKMTDLGTLGGTSSTAYTINSADQIVGWSDNSSGQQDAFLWENGKMTDLGTLGGTSSVAVALNNGGAIVGQSATAAGVEHAFLVQSGTMTDLGTLGGTNSNAMAINASGQVVGQSATSGGVEHAFLWQNGTMTDLNNLLPTGTGWVLTAADSISDKGVVVGTGTYFGTAETFEMTIPLTPVASVGTVSATGASQMELAG